MAIVFGLYYEVACKLIWATLAHYGSFGTLIILGNFNIVFSLDEKYKGSQTQIFEVWHNLEMASNLTLLDIKWNGAYYT